MQRLLAHHRPVVGVLHLPPLPGAPFEGPGLQAIVAGALRDAEVLATGGARGVVVENLGDAPFAKEVEPHVVAAMAVVAREVVERFGADLTVGINVLRNDAAGALAVAAASGAGFVRINVHVGAMVTDQGIIEGRAHETLLYRNRVAPGVAIVADHLVKHAGPLAPVDSVQLARDTLHRAGARVLVLSGSGTGQPTSVEELEALRAALPEATFWIGSGLNPDNAGEYSAADAAIVGTALHGHADLSAPLDVERVRAVVQAFSS